MSTWGRAEAYDRHMGRYASELAVGFVAFAGVAPGMRALDVGCGPGALAQELARVVGSGSVAAADPSGAFVETCRQSLPAADVRVAAAEQLPFPDAGFEAVLSQLVVQALEDPLRAGLELVRVTAPGGLVALCVWDFRGGMPLLGSFWAAARTIDPAGASSAGAYESSPWCTPEGLRRLLAESGLEDVETGQLSASASYTGFEDIWSALLGTGSPSGAYLRSLGEEEQLALARAFRRQLGVADEPFRLTARAWAARGRVPAEPA